MQCSLQDQSKNKNIKMKAENTSTTYSMIFTCSEISKQIHSVHQIRSLVTNVCSKIKDRQYSKSIKAAQIKMTFSYICFKWIANEATISKIL